MLRRAYQADVRKAGALTSGSVLIADSSGRVSQDNAALYYDAANNRLAIGANSGLPSTTGITVQGADASLSSYWLQAYDSSARLITQSNNDGRIDLLRYSETAGAVMTLGIMPDTPANNQQGGHYAFTAKDDQGNRHTIALVDSLITDISNSALRSSIRLYYMDTVDGTPGGVYSYQQPNQGFTFDRTGISHSLGTVRFSSPVRVGNGTTTARFEVTGSTTDPTQGGVVLSPTLSLSTNGRASIYSTSVITPTAALTHAYGLLFLPTVTGTEGVTTNTVGTVYGVLARVDTAATYDSNITTGVINFFSQAPVHAGGGTISTLWGFYSDINTGASGITNAYQLYMAGNAPSFVGGNLVVAGQLGIAASDTALVTTEGTTLWRTTRKFLTIYDATRERQIGSVGFQPRATMLGATPTDTYTTAVNLAAVSAGNGGAIAIPIVVTGHMLVQGIAIWNTDTASARTAEWRLYEDRSDASNTLNEISGLNGTWSFTPGAAAVQSSDAATPGTYLGPGLYWLVIRNTSASQTFGVGSAAATASGAFFSNTAQTKAIASLGSTLDFVAATWTKVTALYGAALNGRVFGQSTAF